MLASPPQPVRVHAVKGFIAFDSGGIGSRSHAEQLSLMAENFGARKHVALAPCFLGSTSG